MAVSPEDYREALRKFASGITIVTVAHGNELHGMTASSFAAASLSPPLVLVCLERSSRTRSLVLEASSFAANILGDHQESIARSFSESGPKPFQELRHRPGKFGAPLLEGAIAWIECSVWRVIETGDHDVIVGEVQACDSQPGLPLVYFNRSYRSLPG
jgi:flavin reductase (DIM6/NTAB) family NADH-FMN oxidoreductase RutF